MFVTVYEFAGVSKNTMNFMGCALLMDFFKIFTILLYFYLKHAIIIFNLLHGYKVRSFRVVT